MDNLENKRNTGASSSDEEVGAEVGDGARAEP
jgi:hypothetical protein